MNRVNLQAASLAAAFAALLHLGAPPRAFTGDPLPLGPSHQELDCEDCHPGAEPAEAIYDCTECHPGDVNIHPVNVIAEISIPEGFDLGPGGELLCRSCHVLHGGDEENSFLNFGKRGRVLDRNAYCAQCHGVQLSRTNPHQARTGENRCSFCHASITEGLGGKDTARMEIVKLCDFCHGALARNHPRNVDPSLDIPDFLPRGPGGEWNCITCHEPHGTTNTTHYVRPEFAFHIERGKEWNPHRNEINACKACHVSQFSDEIRAADDLALRYKGDIGVLCVSCHITDRGHHPTGIRITAQMSAIMEAAGASLAFDAEGRINCYTCHDNSCSTDEQKMVLRYYDGETLSTDLCWLCHQRDEFSSKNPHVDDPEFCIYCHESQPVPGLSQSLLAVAEMVCLHCHLVKPHPAGANHLKEPTGSIVPDEKLRLGPNGKVTCTTCHQPHATEDLLAYRLHFRSSHLCQKCHWK